MTEADLRKKLEEELQERMGRSFLGQGSFLIWLIIAVLAAVIAPIVVAIVTSKIFGPWAVVVAEIIVLAVLIYWLRICLQQIGSAEVPSQAVLTRFARSIDAVRTGLHFRLHPVETFKEFPTGLWIMLFRITKGLYSKEAGSLSSQPIVVTVGVYLRFPRVNRLYRFPLPKEEIERRYPGLALDEGGLKEGLAWCLISGRELLVRHLYYRLPVPDPMKATVDDLGKFFEPGVLGALRQVLSTKTHLQQRVEKAEIEKEVKAYLVSEIGNPFYECGIPPECLDIEITMLELPDETAKAFMAPELAKKGAEAAVHEKSAITERLGAYIDKGVDKEVAALIVGGMTGEGMTFEQLRDLKILQRL